MIRNEVFGAHFHSSIFPIMDKELLFLQVGTVKPERSIPDTILKGAKGLAILTVMKVGMMVTYKLGTGLVVARRADGSWSAPSAVASCGVGWGPQVNNISCLKVTLGVHFFYLSLFNFVSFILCLNRLSYLLPPCKFEWHGS